MEVWKPIEGCKYYYVSNMGRVKKETDNSVYMLKLRTDKRGYQVASIHKNNVSKPQLVHRLVATAFVANPYKHNRIKHLNGDISDNRADNLIWTEGNRSYKQRKSTATNVDVKKFQELVDEGLGITEIARRLCVPRNSLKSRGFVSANNKRFTDPQKLEQATELISLGIPTYKVCRRVGIGYATLKRYGIIKSKDEV